MIFAPNVSSTGLNRNYATAEPTEDNPWDENSPKFFAIHGLTRGAAAGGFSCPYSEYPANT
jgi:hypothetical protein